MFKYFSFFRFAVFLENRFVFHSNMHFLISKISFHQICTSFQCSNDRVCLTITWHYLNWLQIWPQDGATFHLQADLCFISMYRVYLKGRYNVLNFTWHHLNWLQIWSPGGATSNSCKLALITSLHHLHCLIALNCPLGIINQYCVGIFIRQSHIS